jgi:hypothetical protein
MWKRSDREVKCRDRYRLANLEQTDLAEYFVVLLCLQICMANSGSWLHMMAEDFTYFTRSRKLL